MFWEVSLLARFHLMVCCDCAEWWLMLVDQIFLAIYIVELSLKLYVWRLRFFKQFWNNFGNFSISFLLVFFLFCFAFFLSFLLFFYSFLSHPSLSLLFPLFFSHSLSLSTPHFLNQTPHTLLSPLSHTLSVSLTRCSYSGIKSNRLHHTTHSPEHWCI